MFNSNWAACASVIFCWTGSLRASRTHLGGGGFSRAQRAIVCRVTPRRAAARPKVPNAVSNTGSSFPGGDRRSKRDEVTDLERGVSAVDMCGCVILSLPTVLPTCFQRFFQRIPTGRTPLRFLGKFVPTVLPTGVCSNPPYPPCVGSAGNARHRERKWGQASAELDGEGELTTTRLLCLEAGPSVSTRIFFFSRSRCR
jgi:hypothetical protein